MFFDIDLRSCLWLHCFTLQLQKEGQPNFYDRYFDVCLVSFGITSRNICRKSTDTDIFDVPGNCRKSTTFIILWQAAWYVCIFDSGVIIIIGYCFLSIYFISLVFFVNFISIIRF